MQVEEQPLKSRIFNVFIATSLVIIKINVLKGRVIRRGREMVMISIHIRRNPRMTLQNH